MKSEFILNFISAIFTTAGEMISMFSRESWHYKNLRIGGYDPGRLYKNLSNLKHRGILSSDRSGYFKFTKKGKTWANNSIRRYFIKKDQKWDGKWRVVIFDIPNNLHKSRIKFRRRLKYIGFCMLQKSVFIFPYPCEEELADICKDLHIADYVDLILAERPGYKDGELRKFYNL